MQLSDLGELNFENLGTWPLPAKLLVIGLACIVILVMATFLLIKPELARLDTDRAQEQTLLEQYTEKAGQASNIDIYKHQLVIIRKMLNDVIQQLPKRADIPNLIEDISKLGVASGLEFDLIKPAPEVDKGYYVELPVELTVVGNYHQLASFISSVANMQRIVTLDNFKITRVIAPANAANTSVTVSSDSTMREDKLRMDVTAKTYHYEGTKPAATTSATGGSSG